MARKIAGGLFGKPRRLSDKDRSRLEKSIIKHVEKHTPLPDNICKEEECGGEVIKRVSSLFRGEFHYHLPECEKCGRSYHCAKNVRPVGVAEFERAINTPVTI